MSSLKSFFNPKFILRYPTGDYVAIDTASGGYPYASNDIFSANRFYTKEAAEGYKKMFQKENFTMCELDSFTIKNL